MTYRNAEWVQAGVINCEIDANGVWQPYGLTAASNPALYATILADIGAYDPSLDDVKAARLRELGEVRRSKEYGGVSFGGGTLPTDDKTRAVFATAYVRAVGDENYNLPNFKYGPGVWAAVDNATVQAAALAIEGHIQGCFAREKALNDLILAAVSISAVEAIDITTGWPT